MARSSRKNKKYSAELKFTDAQELTDAIENYIQFYNTKRYQKRLKCMTPMEYHEEYYATAA